MRILFITVFVFNFIGCVNNRQSQPSLLSLATEANLKGINETRMKFIKAVKEGDGGTIKSLVTEDVKTIGPGSADWQEMYTRSINKGPFPYDSIVMFPHETILASDSIAYDFGVSNVYYTNEEGEVVELHDTFLAILKKGKDGIWRLHREVASSRVQE